MKKMLVCLMMVVFCGTVGAAEELQVVFAIGEWAPYVSETLPEYGAATKLVTAICRAGGMTPVYKFYPWNRAEMLVAQGEVFGSFPYAITKERQEQYDFSDILFYGANELVYYVKNPKTATPVPYETLADLKAYRIGILLGTTFLAKTLDEAGMKYEMPETVDQLIQMLVKGRIDFALDNQTVLYPVIQKLYPNEVENFKALPKIFGEKMSNAVMVSRKFPGAQEILQKFNAGLAIIKQNGEYDRIIEKYHLVK